MPKASLEGIDNGWEIELLPRLGLVQWVRRFRPPSNAATSVIPLVVLLIFPSHGMEYRRRIRTEESPPG